MSEKSYPTGGEFLLRDTDPAECFTPEDFDENQRMIAQTVEDFVARHIDPVREKFDYEIVTEKTRLFGLKGKEIVIRAWAKEEGADDAGKGSG